MLKQSRSLRLSINIYVLNAIYTYYTVAHRSECDDWRFLLLLRTWNCAFAIAVRCMVVVLKTSLEIHINCLFPLLDLLQSSKAIKGTRTVIGHAQVFLFSSPCKHACSIFVDLRYWHLQNGNATLGAEAAENEQPAAVYAWLTQRRRSPACGACQLLMKSKA